jgi:acyl carrier protein
MNQIKQKVADLISEYLKKESLWLDESSLQGKNFKETLGLDSLDFSGLILYIEEKTQMIIPDHLIESSDNQNYDVFVNNISEFLFSQGYEC